MRIWDLGMNDSQARVEDGLRCVCVLCRDALRDDSCQQLGGIRRRWTNLNGHRMRNSLRRTAVRNKRQSSRLYRTRELIACSHRSKGNSSAAVSQLKCSEEKVSSSDS